MRNIRQYEIVVEIFRQGSISKAAKFLHISQPTLSKILQKLEDEIHIELFDRTCMPLKLTTAGKLFVESGQQIVDLSRQLDKRLDELKSSASTSVCIGISPSRAPYCLPQFVHKYKECIPDGKVIIKEGSTAQLNTLLLRGEADIIISLLNDSTKSFRCVPLFSETTVLAVPMSMENLSADEILHSQPFITLPSGMRMWNIMTIIMSRLNRKMPEIECQSIESAMSLVEDGLGAMIVPEYVMNGYRDVPSKICFKKLPEHYYRNFENELNRNVCVFYRNDQFLSNAAKGFIEACKNASNEI